MRRLLTLALALSAVPVLAQDAPEVEREIVIDLDTLDIDGPVGVEIERDDDGRRIIIRRRGDGEVEEDVLRLRLPEPGEDGVVRFFGPGELGARAFEFEMPRPEDLAELRDLELDGPLFRSWFDGDGPGTALRLFNRDGVAPETRERMRTLQREAEAIAREARAADGAERERLVGRLDAVLGELFEVRAQARQEEADRLRERARELMEEADDKEAALRERDAHRQALIDARRAELLGETAPDW